MTVRQRIVLAGSVAAKIADRSFHVSPCLARSLVSLSRAFSASLALGDPSIANN